MQKLLLILFCAATVAGCNSESVEQDAGAPPAVGAPAGATGTNAATSAPPLTALIDPHAQGTAVALAVSSESTTSPGCYPLGPPRRLTRKQVVNALTDVTAALTADTALAATVGKLVSDTAQFPPDTAVNPDTTRHKGYERLDTTVNGRQVFSLRETAQALAKAMTSDPTRMAKLSGTCTDTADACVTGFIRKAGRLLFRQPMTDAEVNVYRTAAGNTNTPSAFARVLATMIASPKFYFVIEKGQTSSADASSSCMPLTAHEQATRLALHFWDSVPDAALNADADSGALLQPATYTAQVTRMMSDARADRAMRDFFGGWFRLDELVALNGKVGDPKFDAFAGSFKPLPTSSDAAINEVLDMVSYLAAHNASLQQVLTDRHSYARTSDIASLYKTAVWDGVSSPPVFSESTRVGLLTRIGFIAQGSSDTTLPISRGSRVLFGLTCKAMPTPAMVQSNAKADLSGLLTTRQRVERVTEMNGTSCVGCHKPLMNPWGFVFEGFDSLGRVRETEVILDDKGKSLGEKPIDTASLPSLADTMSRAVRSPSEAQQFILDSGQFERCFARNYVRYAFGRADTAGDGALIESLRQQAVSGANLRSLFASIALRSEFTTIQRAK
ncbi:MAG: DUF1592 domain-containing protein [Burkholderiales bacterium]|nr:DUF1592 domain-containing protein [Burkholderiales bacterium]